MPKATLRDIPIKGKRLFIRVDFNVPLTKAKAVADDTRIRAALPTISYALEQGASVVLASHLGRPKGQVDAAFSLQPVAIRLQELLRKPVRPAPDGIGVGPQTIQRFRDVIAPAPTKALPGIACLNER